MQPSLKRGLYGIVHNLQGLYANPSGKGLGWGAYTTSSEQGLAWGLHENPSKKACMGLQFLAENVFAPMPHVSPPHVGGGVKNDITV